MEFLDWLKVNGYGSFGALGAVIGACVVAPRSKGELATRILLGFLVSFCMTPLLAPVAAGMVEQWAGQGAGVQFRETPAPLGVVIGLVAYWVVGWVIAIVRNTKASAETDGTTYFDLQPSEPQSPWDREDDDNWNWKPNDRSEGEW